MLRIGEESGSVEEMMSRTADYYEKEVDQQIKTINTIIEPALMIVLGIVALIIVAALQVQFDRRQPSLLFQHSQESEALKPLLR
jgi:type IV pilus assembly protein PilC